MGDNVLVIDENTSWSDIAYVIIQVLATVLIMMVIIIVGPVLLMASIMYFGSRGEGYNGYESTNTKPQRPINNTFWRRGY